MLSTSGYSVYCGLPSQSNAPPFMVPTTEVRFFVHRMPSKYKNANPPLTAFLTVQTLLLSTPKHDYPGQPEMPLKLFTKKLDRREKLYIRPSLQLTRTESTESIASDATAPDLPGPGRNLGRLFDAVGARIEYHLNSTVGRFKLGPNAIVLEIRNIRCYRHDSLGSEDLHNSIVPTGKEYCTLKKLCRRLLKCCR